MQWLRWAGVARAALLGGCLRGLDGFGGIHTGYDLKSGEFTTPSTAHATKAPDLAHVLLDAAIAVGRHGRDRQSEQRLVVQFTLRANCPQ